jgi:ribokinase
MPERMAAPCIAVVGHVEHVTLGRGEGAPGEGGAAAKPLGPGDIVHLREARFLPGGGGGIAFAQLCRSEAEVHLFTALGQDEAGRAVKARLREATENVHVHAAVRGESHPRVVVVVDAEGRRMIIVTGAPLQPAASDPLPWPILAGCDAVYFTGADPGSLRLARAARRLVVTARRSAALKESGITPDVIVGSAADPRESAPFEAYHPSPGALVLTDGPRPIRVIRRDGVTLVDAPPSPARVAGDYGAGDSFAGALTFFLAHGLPVEEACGRAGPYGAAVLEGIDPFERQQRLVTP